MKPGTQEENAMITRMVEEGPSIAEIASNFPGRLLELWNSRSEGSI